MNFLLRIIPLKRIIANITPSLSQHASTGIIMHPLPYAVPKAGIYPISLIFEYSSTIPAVIFYRVNKMKTHLYKSIIIGFILLTLLQEGSAQRVRHIKVTDANARLYRDSLKMKIFGSTNFPYSIVPDSVYTNVNSLDHYIGFPYSSIIYPSGNLDSLDKFVISLNNNAADFPEKVKAYLFHPHTSNGKLFIYHSGHCAGIATTEDVFGNNLGIEPGLVIPRLIAEGYTVLAVPMINYQSTSQPGLICGANNHDRLFTDGYYQYPLEFFFKPLIASLNLLGRSNYSSIYMCGLSGGGWTTSIYPAIDSSISISFPVAGSWPVPVRTYFNEGGDYEQFYPPIIPGFLDYHEMYALACLAPARKMLQVNNRYDACCFGGSFAQIFYVDSVAKTLGGTDAMFKFYLDETDTGHQVSSRTLEVMLTFIRNETAFLQAEPIDSIHNGMNYFYDIKNNFALNVPPDNSTLKYSLLKAPGWLSLDSINGQLHGVVPISNIIVKPDSVSFKAEDSTGRFVLYNYNLIRKRDAPYFFTQAGDEMTLYCLPHYTNSLAFINPLIAGSFYFSDPSLFITDITVENNSVIKIKLNDSLDVNDSIGYNGFISPYAITYNNGLKLDNFGLTAININAIKKYYAVAGMIRFNTDTNKFEYFNGVSWVDMN